MTTDSSPGPAGIQYMGEPGSSVHSRDAIVRLIQFGDRLSHARVLSHDGYHAILVTTDIGDLIAIRSGFTSGYGGEGPAAFSYVLALLEAHGIETDEIDVSSELLARLDLSALTVNDLEIIHTTKRAHPRRLSEYISERDWERAHSGAAWREFPALIPFRIIDLRIVDLARAFWTDPDGRLLTAWRRLEGLIRERLDASEHGTKLLSTAFVGDKSRLVWPGVDAGEQTGRGNVFTGAYAAYRNPRAHRELKPDSDAQLAELLLVNQLYRWEGESIERPAKDS